MSSRPCLLACTVIAILLSNLPSNAQVRPEDSQRAETPLPPALPAPPSAVQGPTPQERASVDSKSIPAGHASDADLKAEEKQSIAGFIPNMNTVISGEGLPLTAGQKWDLAYHGAINPFYVGTAFVLSGYNEVTSAQNNGFGWGPKGYFESTGAAYLDSVNSIMIGNALLPVLLHQDPRYFRKGEGSIASRVVYSALQVVVCRGDNGRRQLNISNIGGNFISGTISNFYYPASDRGVSHTIWGAITVTGEGAIGNELLEFATDWEAAASRQHQRHLDKMAARQAVSVQR